MNIENEKAEKDFTMLINDFSRKLDKLPDGRVNYANSNKAPVLACFVRFKNDILILKRSDKVSAYKGKWNCIGGYLDEIKPVRKKVLEELREELGILQEDIKNIKIAKPVEIQDDNIDKTWISFIVLVELTRKPEIKLDWEHTDFKWIKPDEIKNYDIVYKLDESLKKALSLDKS